MQEIPGFLEVLNDEELDQFSDILSKIIDGMYQEIKAADPTWFNKMHQIQSHYLSKMFHDGEKE
ncbi:hypothetical protein ABTQ33_00085 [Paucilactobacillus suebicus]|uniref:Uncharacterized protein n=1 Tax=Paucilactobacillus suebicus DSM 5007 = KCTC 3549 TaxID=1423807 RepID=A0A0R1W4T4_9LACO|nr:hypothetical protein [Paucilactobacillus suebicus]KRM12634.1 hypothetical protein FD16_GL002149 [Paucilactobacillus suebicus DSM 5007 = KCTC 3549]